MSTEQAILAGQVGNAGAETAMKLYAAAGGARIAAGSARSTSIIASTIVKRGYQRLADSLAQLIKPIGLSKKGIKHASKHLPEFKELDNSFTLDKLLRLGQRIARNEKNLVNSKTYGSKTYQATVRVGKKDVSVKSVLNASGNLRSVHIAK